MWNSSSDTPEIENKRHDLVAVIWSRRTCQPQEILVCTASKSLGREPTPFGALFSFFGAVNVGGEC
jgi:hypothetical protein